MDKTTIEGLPELFGGKYYVDKEKRDGVLEEYKYGDVTYYVYEKDACPIGYAVDKYFIESDIYNIPKENRGKALLEAVAIEADEEYKVNGKLEKVEAVSLGDIADTSILVQEAINSKVDNFVRTDKGFTCTSNYIEDEYVFFSVPYEEGWTAYLDGIETQIIEADHMMMIEVTKGQHDIEFVHNTRGFRLGVVASLCATVTLIVLGCMDYVRKKKKDGLV